MFKYLELYSIYVSVCHQYSHSEGGGLETRHSLPWHSFHLRLRNNNNNNNNNKISKKI